MYLHKSYDHTADFESEPIHTWDQAFGSLGSKGPLPSPTTRVHAAFAAVNPEATSHKGTRNYVQRQIAREESGWCEKCSHPALQETVEHVFSDVLKAGDFEVRKELKTAFYKFVKTVLPNMIDNGALDEVFDRSIDSCVQSTLLYRCISQSRTISFAIYPSRSAVHQIADG